MRALVVYESMFGNTQRVAEAIADGMAGHARVVVHEVSEVPATLHPEFDLLVVGGPTHAWSMSRPRTREGARQQGAQRPVSPGIGIREWLGRLPAAPADLPVATFDTRLNKPSVLTGSAARVAAKRLRRLGYRLVDRESFFVTGSPGPLGPDELDRARQWGMRLTREATPVEH